jgi:hypothetical protein
LEGEKGRGEEQTGEGVLGDANSEMEKKVKKKKKKKKRGEREEEKHFFSFLSFPSGAS